MKKVYLELGFVFLILLFASFVLASHVVITSTGASSFSFNEDTTQTYNISVNNTDSLATANITQVNITIPSNFTFIDATNATSLVGTTFVNSSTVLSWTNSTIYLLNASEIGYFWFNASVASPGDYNITVTSVNITGSYTTNLSVEINDTTSPTVTLIDPTNGTSSTSTSWNFTFNVTDYSTISSCNLFINNSLYNTLSSVTKDVTLSMYNTSFGEGDYNWTIGCTDSSGNMANASRFFTVSPAVSSDSSGGSTGSGIIDNSFDVSDVLLKKGYEKKVYRRYTLNFNIGEDSHSLYVLDINSEKIKLLFSSEPIEITFDKGEIREIDLDGDGIKDIAVEIKEINYPSADIVLSSLENNIVENSNLEDNPSESFNSDLESGELKSFSWLKIIGILLIVLVLVYFGYYFYLKDKTLKN